MQDIFPLGIVQSLKITVYFIHQKEMRHLNLKIIIPDLSLVLMEQ